MRMRQAWKALLVMHKCDATTCNLKWAPDNNIYFDNYNIITKKDNTQPYKNKIQVVIKYNSSTLKLILTLNPSSYSKLSLIHALN